MDVLIALKLYRVLELAGLNHVIYKLDEHFDRQSFYGQFGEGFYIPSSFRFYQSWWMYRNSSVSKGEKLV